MRYMIFIILVCLSLSCSKADQAKPAITIGTIRVSAKEFERAYQVSYFSQAKEDGRKAFLDVFIARKLMLKEAERMNLNRDPEFLSDIQLFWEQSLLKRLLLKKAGEAALPAGITDAEAESFYNQEKDNEFSGKSFAQVKDQVKMLVARQRQQKMIDDWVSQMRRQVNISIDYQSLKISSDK